MFLIAPCFQTLDRDWNYIGLVSNIFQLLSTDSILTPSLPRWHFSLFRLLVTAPLTTICWKQRNEDVSADDSADGFDNTSLQNKNRVLADANVTFHDHLLVRLGCNNTPAHRRRTAPPVVMFPSGSSWVSSCETDVDLPTNPGWNNNSTHGSIWRKQQCCFLWVLVGLAWNEFPSA